MNDLENKLEQVNTDIAALEKIRTELERQIEEKEKPKLRHLDYKLAPNGEIRIAVRITGGELLRLCNGVYVYPNCNAVSYFDAFTSGKPFGNIADLLAQGPILVGLTEEQAKAYVDYLESQGIHCECNVGWVDRPIYKKVKAALAAYEEATK